MKKNQLRSTVAVACLALTLAACGGNGDGDTTATGAPASGDTEAVLPMPEIDDSDGLVINGEEVASAELLEAARGDVVQWYTATGTQSAELTAARFRQETGIELEMTRLPSSRMYERVLSEFGADRLTGGVVTLTDALLADDLSERGVFVEYTDMPTHERLMESQDAQWDEGKYYTASYAVYGFAYNDALVEAEDAPSSWEDLLDERWRDQLSLVHAGAGGTTQGVARFQEVVLGDDYWQRLAAQNPQVVDTTSVQLDALTRGEVEAVLTDFSPAFAAEQAGAPITFVVPTEGVSATYQMQGLTPAGIDSPAAQVFMNWTWSESGQEFLAAQGFVGAFTDVEQPPSGEYQLPSASDPLFWTYTADEAEQFGRDTVARWNTAFGYSG